MATNDEESGRVTPVGNKRPDSRGPPETSYESSANGHKIAFDPRDISESEERNKQPKLTLMEEILLMGLKDKQVHISSTPWQPGLGHESLTQRYRAISLSGTTTSHMHFGDA